MSYNYYKARRIGPLQLRPLTPHRFITEPLQLFALRRSLLSSTPISLVISLGCAFALTAMATFDPRVTLSATLCILGAIGTTVAALVVLLHWTLGVVESAIITLTVGRDGGWSIMVGIYYKRSLNDGDRLRAEFC